MLFDSIIYGPIHSRRLGVSLGVNLMPEHHKLCTFDCVYCEIGWNSPISHPQLPTRQEVQAALEAFLSTYDFEQSTIDVITFSGNGEPSLHPDFEGIIEDTCALRDRYCSKAKVSVLSNSTQLGRPDVVRALKKCDNRILKLDSALDETMRLIDQPTNKNLTVRQIMDWLGAFDGDFTLQTCFLRGEHKGQKIDNTSPEELTAWYQAVETLRPKQIMIYVIDRATPCQTLEKLSREEMETIATPLIAKGYNVLIS
ncbi:MAG: radical SAM protein [Paludibacteraceae bacterium]|nr:radical SAM protein [Paludibacteraceae bacterium]